jgi:hypothetical protein
MKRSISRLLSPAMLAVCATESLAQYPEDGTALLNALADPATTVDASTRLITLGNFQPEIRQQVNHELPGMLLQTKNVPVVQNEAKVAGALRLESTIPSLIQLLSWFNGDLNTTMTTSHRLLDDPVARALYQIGGPSERPLAEVLNGKNQLAKGRAMSILILRGTPESRSILEKHLSTETDPHFKNYLIANGIKAQQ